MNKAIIAGTIALLTLVRSTNSMGDYEYKENPRSAEKIEVALPAFFVEAFPMIVCLTMSHNPAAHGRFARIIPEDLASTTMAGVDISFIFSAASAQKVHVGQPFLGLAQADAPIGAPEDLRVQGDEHFALTLDIATLARAVKVYSELPSAGRWSVTVIESNYAHGKYPITIRPATAVEQDVAAQLAVKGTGKSWFPTVALSDDPVPDASKLPAETRQIVKLIGILRSAVKSREGGIKAIDDATEEWGYLDPLITFIRYECLLKLDRKDDAEKLRSRDPEFGRDLQFNLIDEGKGLIARLQALKARQQAEKKQSAGP